MSDIIISDLASYATFLDYQKQHPDKDITIKELNLRNTDITIIRLPNVVKVEGNFIIENNYELKIIIDLYSTCEEDFQNGINLFEAMVELKTIQFATEKAEAAKEAAFTYEIDSRV